MQVIGYADLMPAERLISSGAATVVDDLSALATVLGVHAG
jgi:hypothetical protein